MNYELMYLNCFIFGFYIHKKNEHNNEIKK